MKPMEARIDLEYLETMSGGDADMRQTLLEMLIDELPRERGRLSDAVDRQDIAALFQASHSLKSTLAYTGDAEVIRLNERVEESSRHGRWPEADQVDVQTLLAHLDTLIEALKALVR